MIMCLRYKRISALKHKQMLEVTVVSIQRNPATRGLGRGRRYRTGAAEIQAAVIAWVAHIEGRAQCDPSEQRILCLSSCLRLESALLD